MRWPGKVDRLVAHAFHQAAVAGNDEGMVVDEVAVARRKRALGDRHADRGGEALAERAGGRLDAERMAVFGMASGLRAELPEALDLLDRHVRIAGQIEQRVEQHRAVAGRQHEAVPVGPMRVGGIEFEKLGEQHRRDVGHAHRHARMAGLGFLDRIHRQEADGVGHGRVRDGGSLNNRIHFRRPFRKTQARIARRRRSTSFRIIGVRMSCMAMSSLPPGMTIELARLMKLLWIIDRR